jgi:hypothetical protein
MSEDVLAKQVDLVRNATILQIDSGVKDCALDIIADREDLRKIRDRLLNRISELESKVQYLEEENDELAKGRDSHKSWGEAMKKRAELNHDRVQFLRELIIEIATER